MSEAEADNVGQLSSTQQDALQQYLQVTNQEVKDAIPILERSQWNVQIAIAKFFDGDGPDLLAEAIAAENVPQMEARHENLQESLFASEFAPRAPRRDRTDPAPRIVPRPPVTTPWLIGLLLAPFGWGWSAATSLFRVLLYTISFLPASIRPRIAAPNSSNATSSATRRRMLMPRDAAARFKREFDEEYGPNDLPFIEDGIAQAHDAAKRDLKFLMVILLSQEHDDTQSFVRETLLSPEVVAFIKEKSNSIILWGGNVVDSEAYQVAAEYTCTKFPFTALVCLTPKEGSTRMGIVKRLVGPIPAAEYLQQLRGAVEKYGADMDGVRAERTAQEFSRSLRDEQDSAYERSLAKDRERARERREAAVAAAEAARLALKEREAEEIRAEKRRQWRKWRAARIKSEPPTSERKVVRIALMMPEGLGGERVVRRFAPEAPVEELYAFVECYDMLREGGEEELAAAEKKPRQPNDYEHEYMFRIFSTLPRIEYTCSEEGTMGENIGKSGNLVVEEICYDSDYNEDDEEEEEADENDD